MIEQNNTNIPVNQVVTGDNVAVLSTMPDACIDLVVTSPPYDNLRTYGGHTWDFEGVARELTRVLKPGGKFCYADLHEAGEQERISEWLSEAGFEMDVCEDITGGVLDALRLDSARKQQLINHKAPWWLRKPVGAFAGLVGTRTYRSFVTGARQYTRWQLTKPEGCR